MTVLAAVAGAVVVLELVALAGRRTWVHWKLGRRAPLADEALTALAEALVSGRPVERPPGRVRRLAFRLAALELFPALAGESRAQLTRLVDDAGLVDDAIRTLRRSPRAFARRRAADELGEIRSARAAPALAAGLADRDPIVRVACARGLALVGDTGELDRVQQALDRDAPAAPAEAASALVALAAAVPYRVARLQESARAPLARRLAALALAQTGDERAMPSLLQELAADNALLSFVAVRAIERVGGDEAIASLERVAADGARDAALREQAGRALARATGGAP
jgi:HEAT repeat protein